MVKKIDPPHMEDRLLVSCGGLGFLPFAPGTWGSLGSILVGGLLVWLGLAHGVSEIITLVLVLATAGLFWLGLSAADRVMQAEKIHDSSHIVIDEWVGQWVALLIFVAGMGLSGSVSGSFTMDAMAANHGIEPMLVGGLMLTGLFLFFRYFDIAKPGRIGWADRHLEGGYGVMMDDVFAGIYAGFSALAVAWFISLII